MKPMMGTLLRTALVGVLFATTGCATLVKGTTQGVNVMTDPPGAACDLVRDGKAIAAVAMTPQSVTIDKSVDDITVNCRKDGYEETQTALVSSATGWTAGNIFFGLLGGPIALGIDAASGAMTEYPNAISVTLIPANFPTEADRDTFYDRMVEEIKTQADAAIAEVRQHCRTQQNCDAKVVNIETERDRRIAEIESKRGRAAISPSAPQG